MDTTHATTEAAVGDARLADIHRAQQIEGCDTVGLHGDLRQILVTGATPPELVPRLIARARVSAARHPSPRRSTADRWFRSRPYIDRHRLVLRNLPGLPGQAALDELTGQLSAVRTAEILGPRSPLRPLPVVTRSDTLQDLHRRLFGDVFGWAGELRTVNLSRRDLTFCSLPEVEDHLNLALLALDRCLAAHHRAEPVPVVDLATFLAEYIWAHPFRDGNGRSAMAVLMLLTPPGTLSRIGRADWYRASAASVTAAVTGSSDPRPWVRLLSSV
jgi:cell filamentation protein